MFDDCNANNLWLYAMHSAQHHGTQWFQIAKTHQKLIHFIMFDVISRIFQSTSVSGKGMIFTSSSRQTVAGIRLVCQFHRFFEFIFWRIFAIWPNCVAWQAENLDRYQAGTTVVFWLQGMCQWQSDISQNQPKLPCFCIVPRLYILYLCIVKAPCIA